MNIIIIIIIMISKTNTIIFYFISVSQMITNTVLELQTHHKHLYFNVDTV